MDGLVGSDADSQVLYNTPEVLDKSSHSHNT